MAQDTLAATAAMSALAAAGAPWIITVEPYVHVAASIVACIGGIFAVYYHYKRVKHLNQKMKDKDDD